MFFDEAFVGWLVVKNTVMHIDTVTAAGDTRRGIDMKKACNQNASTCTGLLKVSGLSLSGAKIHRKDERKAVRGWGFFCLVSFN